MRKTFRSRRTSIRMLAMASACAAAATFAPRAEALTFTWNGNGANSNWNTAANWQNSIVPSSSYSTDLVFSGANRKSNVNNYAGTFLMNSLTLNGNSWWLSGNAFGLRGGGFIRSSGTNNLISNNISLAVNGVNKYIDVLGGAGSSLTLSGILSGAGWLRINDGALVSLNGTNTHGGSYVNVGTLNANLSSLGQAVTVSSEGVLNWSEGADASFSGPIGGSGSINKYGAGNLTLSGNNSFEGGFLVKDGTLTLNGLAAGGFANYALDGAGSAIVLNESGNVTDRYININDGVGGSTFTKTGNGTVDSYLISSGVNVFVNGGTLRAMPFAMTNKMTIGQNGNLELFLAQGQSTNYGGQLYGTGTFTKTGAGTASWTVAQNNFTGLTKILGGTLAGESAVFGNRNIDLGSQGVLSLQNGVFNSNLTGTGIVTVAGVDFRKAQNGWLGELFTNSSVMSTIGPNSALREVKVGYGGKLTLDATTGAMNPTMYLTGSGDVTYIGGYTSELLALGDSSFSGSLYIKNNGLYMTSRNMSGRVNFDNFFTYFGFNQDFNGQSTATFFGDGDLYKKGTGTVSLESYRLNSFNGDLQIQDGALRIINGTWNGDSYIAPGKQLIYDNSINTNWTGSIYGDGTFVKAGSGTMSMSDTIEQYGTLQVSGGTVRANNGNVWFESINTQQSGKFMLSGELASATAGSFTNGGELSGNGRINSQFVNQATGKVIANSGKQILFQHDAMNNGSMQLLDGTLSFDTTLINANGGLISGRGILRTANQTNDVGLINNGSVAFSAGYSDVFGDVDNATGGKLIAAGGSTVTYHDDVIHNGSEIRTAAGSRSVFLGGLSGAGSFTGAGTVEVQGDLRPGNSPALVTFAGDLELGDSSTTNIELGGVTMGSLYDSIKVQGNAYLSGTLNVSLINGFNPVYGNKFTIFQGNKIGTFDSIFLPTLTGNLHWDTSNLYTTGTIQSVPEPGTIAAIAVGIAGLLRRRAKSKKA